MKPLIITATTTRNNIGLSRLINSCNKFEWPLEIFDIESWNVYMHKFQGPYEKLNEFRDKGFTHYINLDAWDTIVVGPIDEFVDKIKKLNNPALLISAEMNCYPDKNEIPKYPTINNPFRFVNAVHHMNLEKPVPKGFLDIKGAVDQRHITQYYLNNLNNPEILLDTNCEIYQSLYQCRRESFEIKDGRIHNLITQTSPIFFHGNGKSDMSWIPL